MSRAVRLLCLICAFCLWSAAASAQQLGNCETAKSSSKDRTGDEWLLLGLVEIRCGNESFFADRVKVQTDLDQLIAIGNVVFTSGGSRIAADHAEFNTKTRTGTFYNAWGTATLGDAEADEHRGQFGTKEPDVYFYGATVEKIGPKKYKVTKGGFTTCVQPEPRWELTSSSVTVNLDEYAILKNSLFKVKGFPILYLPLFYYPVQEDDRATGFLLPSYGTSTVGGQSLSNAFFWAINRSQDATFMHDWYTKTGQGYGAEYRYVRERGSMGNLAAHLLDEHGADYVSDDGSTTTTPERRSYEIRGNMTQRVGAGLRATGRVDYFSSLEVQQTYNQNIYEASRRHRIYGGALTGNWLGNSIVGTFNRTETFWGASSSAVRGEAPSIDVRRGERPLLGSPVYFGMNGSYDNLIVTRRSDTTEVDQSLSRFDVWPRIRVPFTRWPFLTVNSSFSFRSTYWTESKDETGVQVEDGITRNYYEAGAQITGPVFNRIWTRPGGRFAEKLKHSIEPFFAIERISAIDQRQQIVQIDSIDSVFGGTTSMEYGITNRLFRKPGGGGTSKEFLTATVRQTYYTDAEARRFDRSYRTSFTGTAPSNFSPVAITVSALPAERMMMNFRADYDAHYHASQSLGADASFMWSDWLRTIGDWSQSKYVTDSGPEAELTTVSHSVNGRTEIRLKRNRFGGSHSFSYDLKDKSFLQQRVMLYYNAQCCGFAVEYQHQDFAGLSFAPVAQDSRFNFSFTLAGIGTFGNFFGALSGGVGDRPNLYD